MSPGPSWKLAEPQKQLANTVLLLDRSLGWALVLAPRFWNMEQDLLLALTTLKRYGKLVRVACSNRGAGRAWGQLPLSSFGVTAG